MGIVSLADDELDISARAGQPRPIAATIERIASCDNGTPGAAREKLSSSPLRASCGGSARGLEPQVLAAASTDNWMSSIHPNSDRSLHETMPEYHRLVDRILVGDNQLRQI